MSDKDMDMAMGDEAIEQALDFLEAGNEMTDDELERLMADEAVGEAVRDLLDCKQAVLESHRLIQPDANKEWERFNQFHQQRQQPQQPPRRARLYMLYGSVIGIAATLLLLFGYRWMTAATDSTLPATADGEMVLAAVTEQPGVTLQSGSGETVKVDAATSKTALSTMGVRLKADGTMALEARADETPQRLTLSIPRGRTFDLTLADGTVVCLNTDSRLVYPSRFTGRERRVRLEGEAYFKVAHDRDHPFIVETAQLQTRVLGTQFNVRAYGDRDTHVTLINGSVEVSSQTGSTARLTPGKDAMLQADGTLETTDVDIDSYVYWSEGFFYFDDVTLLSIMQDIGRWYNVSVVFRNPAAKDYKLHFLCDRKGTLEHTINLLNSLQKVTLELEGNTLYVN